MSGELDGHETFDTDDNPTTPALAIVESIHSLPKDDRTFKIVVPKGTTPGEYTVSASLSIIDTTSTDTDNADGDDDPATEVDARTLTDDEPFTVGDAGTNVSNATLALASGESASVGVRGDVTF